MSPAGGSEESRVVAEVVDVVRCSQRLAADEPLDASTRLLDRGLALDSVALLDLVLALEERFGIRFAEQDVTPARFASIASVAQLVARVRAGHRAGEAGDA